MRWFNMKKRLAATALAIVAASAIAVPSAFAAGVYDSTLDAYDISMIPNTSLTPDPNVPTVAATRAAMPAAEVLGLYSVEESGQFIDMQNGQPVYSWAKPKYMLLASNYRTDPSPYLVNLAIGGSPAAIYNPNRAGGGSGPNASLSPSDTLGDDQLVLAMYPTVIVGTGGGTTGYTGTGVAYGFVDNSGLVSTLDDIADASGCTAAEARALAYRQYIFGTIGLVHQAIQDPNQQNVTERSVVLVENATYDEDEMCWIYDVMTSTEAVSQDGTASRNRYLEITTNTGLAFTNPSLGELRVASNLADSLTGTITGSDLAAANLILVGGQQGSGNYANIMTALFDDGLLNQTYFVKDNGSAGACYGVVMNSVENAQNVGRILGMLYPEVINQHNWMAYYYETFYGINPSYTTTVLRKAMSQGVRNASATTTATGSAQAIIDLTNWGNVTVYENGATQSGIATSLASGYSYIANLVTLP